MPAEDLTTDDGVTIRDALIPAQAKAQDRAQGDTYAEPASADTAFQNAADVLASYGYGASIPDGAVVVQNGDPCDLAKKDGSTLAPLTISVREAPQVGESELALALPDGFLMAGGPTIDVSNFPKTVTASADFQDVEGQVVSEAVLDKVFALVQSNTTVTHTLNGTSMGCTYTVADGVITAVSTPAARAVVTTGSTVPLRLNGATANSGVNATLTVANRAVTFGTLPATATLVQNGAALTVPVTGTYTDTATLTVAGGVITGIVLS